MSSSTCSSPKEKKFIRSCRRAQHEVPAPEAGRRGQCGRRERLHCRPPWRPLPGEPVPDESRQVSGHEDHEFLHLGRKVLQQGRPRARAELALQHLPSERGRREQPGCSRSRGRGLLRPEEGGGAGGGGGEEEEEEEEAAGCGPSCRRVVGRRRRRRRRRSYSCRYSPSGTGRWDILLDAYFAEFTPSDDVVLVLRAFKREHVAATTKKDDDGVFWFGAARTTRTSPP